MASPAEEYEALLERYAKVQERYTALGGYEIEERTAKIIQGFRLQELFGRSTMCSAAGRKRW